jgi:hypothetical protein
MKRGPVVIRLNHPRRYRAARRMAAAGWPEHAICRALRLRPERVRRAIAGDGGLWGGLLNSFQHDLRSVA